MPRRSMLFEWDGAAIRLHRTPDVPDFRILVGMRSPEELKRFQTFIEDNTDVELPI